MAKGRTGGSEIFTNVELENLVPPPFLLCAPGASVKVAIRPPALQGHLDLSNASKDCPGKQPGTCWHQVPGHLEVKAHDH